MEDIIYILIAVFWVAFTIFRKTRKEQQTVLPEGSEPRKKPATTFDEVLQELLRPREMMQVDTIEETTEIGANESLNEQFTLEAIESEVNSLDNLSSLESAEEVSGYSSIEFDDEPDIDREENTESILFGFDARRAVIYSIILNRPYA
jgi:hypothetical protein